MNELKQLEPIRKQAAKVKRYLTNLEHASNISRGQAKAAEIARINFAVVVLSQVRNKRKEFGDENPSEFDIELDSYDPSLNDPKSVSMIIRDLLWELKELKKLCEFVCDGNNDPLLVWLGDYISSDYLELKNKF